MLCQLRKKWRHLKAPTQRVKHACGNVLLGVSALRSLCTIHVHLERGIVERLLNTKIGDAGNLAQLVENLVGLALLTPASLPFICTSIGAGNPKLESAW